MSYERLSSTDPVDNIAMKLLSRISIFAPGESIPIDLIFQTAQLEEEGFEGQLQAEDALTRLVELALVAKRNKDDSIHQHRLLAAFTQSVSSDYVAARESVENTFIGVFRRVGESGSLGKVRNLEIHFRYIVLLAMMREDELAFRLCNTLGNYFRGLVNYQESGFYLERALEIDRKILGDNSSELALSFNDLGLTLARLNTLESARAFLLKALALFRERKDLVNAAATLDNLGQLTSTTRIAVARKYLDEAIEIRRNILGPTDPHLAISFHSLGNLLMLEEKYLEARQNFEMALTIRRAAFGEKSRVTANSLLTISSILEAEGKYRDGEVF